MDVSIAGPAQTGNLVVQAGVARLSHAVRVDAGEQALQFVALFREFDAGAQELEHPRIEVRVRPLVGETRVSPSPVRSSYRLGQRCDNLERSRGAVAVGPEADRPSASTDQVAGSAEVHHGEVASGLPDLVVIPADLLVAVSAIRRSAWAVAANGRIAAGGHCLAGTRVGNENRDLDHLTELGVVGRFVALVEPVSDHDDLITVQHGRAAIQDHVAREPSGLRRTETRLLRRDDFCFRNPMGRRISDKHAGLDTCPAAGFFILGFRDAQVGHDLPCVDGALFVPRIGNSIFIEPSKSTARAGHHLVLAPREWYPCDRVRPNTESFVTSGGFGGLTTEIAGCRACVMPLLSIPLP